MNVKFLTINIWFGGKVWENLIPFIHKIRPDILAIQEVYDGHDGSLEKRFRTMDLFREEFGSFMPYDAFGATLLDTSVNVLWGNAIFSRFPIKNSKTIFFDLPFSEYNFAIDSNSRLAPEGMLESEIEIVDKKVFVYSWHGVWNNHGEDTPERKIMGREILKHLKGKNRVILGGDTNMNPASGVIVNIQKELNLHSVFGEELQTTFNLKQKQNPGNFANAPVDMVFASKNIKIIEKAMIEVDISDHFPLKVDFEI